MGKIRHATRVRAAVGAAVVGSLLATSWALIAPSLVAAQGPEYNAKCGQLDCRVERKPAAWGLVGVGSDLRTLKLVYESGGCSHGRGDGRATVTETTTGIEIAVDEEEVVAIDTPDHVVSCPGDVRFEPLLVHLDRPVGGRPITRSPLLASVGLWALFPREVPRVLDLAPGDAIDVLSSQGFGVRRYGRRAGPVTFQTPRPGRRVDHRVVVGLTVGRHLFRKRGLETCMTKAGIRAVAADPTPGDADAPDMELVLYTPRRPKPLAFVALYADPARATQRALGIRRHARAFGGQVARSTHSTIVWTDPPSAKLSRKVHRCVFGHLGRPLPRP